VRARERGAFVAQIMRCDQPHRSSLERCMTPGRRAARRASRGAIVAQIMRCDQPHRLSNAA
jgi:hypothetical protein